MKELVFKVYYFTALKLYEEKLSFIEATIIFLSTRTIAIGLEVRSIEIKSNFPLVRI